MGVETIEDYKGAGVVSRKLISTVVRGDMPLDGGWGYDPEEATRDMAMTRARAEAMAGVVVPAGGTVEFTTPPPYSGTEPLVEAVVRHPQNYPNYPA